MVSLSLVFAARAAPIVRPRTAMAATIPNKRFISLLPGFSADDIDALCYLANGRISTATGPNDARGSARRLPWRGYNDVTGARPDELRLIPGAPALLICQPVNDDCRTGRRN